MKPSALLLLTAVLVAAPGCCQRWDRTDTQRSFSYFGRILSERTQEDVAATSSALGSIPGAVAGDFESSGGRFRTLCLLYSGTPAK